MIIKIKNKIIKNLIKLFLKMINKLIFRNKKINLEKKLDNKR